MSEQEQNEVQDSGKKKSTARPIGGIGQYATIGGRHADVQKSESPDAQTSSISDVRISSSPDVEAPKSSNVKKSKHPDWKQQTIYLPPAQVRKLKMRAVMDAKELSEIVNEALTEYFQHHPDE